MPSERPAALVLSPETPYPVIGGGPMRTASVIEYLRGRYDVEVITCREPGAPDPAASFPQDVRVTVLDLAWHSKSIPARAIRNIRRGIRGVPPLIDRFSVFARQIEAIVRGRTFSVGVIEHFWCAGYAEIFRPVCRHLILNLHNIESAFLDRCARQEHGFQRILFRRWTSSCLSMERDILPMFDTVLVASEADADLVNVPATVYPNAIPMVPQPDAVKRDEIVFSGNLEYYPNTSAVKWFARSVWPQLRTLRPSLTWRLLGRNPHAVRRFVEGDERVILTGPVDDAVALLAESAVAVVPLLLGSGTRIKIIEAWAAGLPVISTTVGAEGLPYVAGRDLVLADSPHRLVEKIVKVLESSALQLQLGMNGRRLYERALTWDAAWNVLKRSGF